MPCLIVLECKVCLHGSGGKGLVLLFQGCRFPPSNLKNWSSMICRYLQASAAGPGMSFGLASPTFWTALSLNVLFLILMLLDRICRMFSRQFHQFTPTEQDAQLTEALVYHLWLPTQLVSSMCSAREHNQSCLRFLASKLGMCLIYLQDDWLRM